MKWSPYAALAVLITTFATPMLAQQPEVRAPRRGSVPVEAALRMREQLKLTDSQATQLEALRKEIVAERQNQAREMIELQSRAAAGLLDREAMREQLQDRREAMRQVAEQRRERIERILTEEQREQIGRAQRMNARRMGMRAPRAAPPFGPGFSPRGFDRGGRFDRGPRRPPMPGRYYWF